LGLVVRTFLGDNPNGRRDPSFGLQGEFRSEKRVLSLFLKFPAREDFGVYGSGAHVYLEDLLYCETARVGTVCNSCRFSWGGSGGSRLLGRWRGSFYNQLRLWFNHLRSFIPEGMEITHNNPTFLFRRERVKIQGINLTVLDLSMIIVSDLGLLRGG
jgi:hypothetical protein